MVLTQHTSELFHARESAPLRDLLEGGQLPALFSGLPAAARAHLAAVLRAETEQPLLVICPDESAAEAFSRDLSHLLGAPVPVLAARDYTFYTALSVSRQTEQRRLGALYDLGSGKSPVVVATVSGLMQRAIPKQTLLGVTFTIEDGGRAAPEDVEDALLRCGYVRTQQVEGPGQFSRRGGILDIFSPSEDNPFASNSGVTTLTPWAFSTLRLSAARSRFPAAASCPRRRRLPRCIPGATLPWVKCFPI